MIIAEREKNMLMAYMMQNITNGYWDLVLHDSTNTLRNNHLANRVADVIKTGQKIFTPIDVHLKKTGGFEKVFSMIQDYADVIEKIKDMSHTQILELKETKEFK
jgi:hypothetical protein